MNASPIASAVASNELMPASLMLLRAHPKKRSQARGSLSAISARIMNTTGKAKPSAIGVAHSSQASAARRPLRPTGTASALPARAPRPAAKRMRLCATRSIRSSATTTTSSTVASCAAAMRLSIDNHAL